jgi:tetratricopeptide (TPR) repeat protein
MKRRAHHVVLLATLVFGSISASPDTQITHKIPPGYVPEEARDEQGLWLEMEEFERRLNKSALLIRNPEITNYINEIVCRVAGDYCRDFRVYVIRNSHFNASMTATGMMQIWTGLIVRAGSTDEIAAVVGHEIAHYTRRHSLQRMRDIRKKMAAGTFFDIALIALSGVNAPVGQMTAQLSALAFSREQETEADVLGVKLLAEASYDPHASYAVWENIVAEEAAAVAKNEDPPIFGRTHPDAEERARYLRSLVNAAYTAPDQEKVADRKLLDILNNNYELLMEDQLDTNRFGRTQDLLERHAVIGVEPSLVRYFYGEMFRQRAGEGDRELAMAAYRHSIEGGAPPAEAYLNLGYLLWKEGDREAAKDNFRIDLELEPDAPDRAMLEFYLEE